MKAKRRTHSLAIWAPFIGVLDLIVVAGSGHLVAYAYYKSGAGSLWPLPESYTISTLVMSVILCLLLNFLGGYRTWRGGHLAQELSIVFLAWVIAFFGFAGMVFLSKIGAYFSRLWIGTWFLVGMLMMLNLRIATRYLLRSLRRKGMDIRNVVLIGGGGLANRVVSVLTENDWLGISLLGYLHDETNPQSLSNILHLGGIRRLQEILDTHDVQQIWIALPLKEADKIKKIVDDTEHRAVDIRLVPDIFDYSLLNHAVDLVADLPVIDLSASPHQGLHNVSKRGIDLMGSLLAIMFLVPLLLIIAVAIRLDSPGPVVFKQLRHGWDGKTFTIFKFRTMTYDPTPTERYEQARRNDSRVTRIGAFLRRSNLDELPQFFNILTGSMSLVGPRPHPVKMNEEIIGRVDRYMTRHKVKPGITGWAQVNGYRGETDTMEKLEGRVQHDLFYIENWSIFLDMKIILLTVLKGFWQKNAY